MSVTGAVDWDQWLRRWDAQQTVYLPDRESRFDAMLDVVQALLPETFKELMVQLRQIAAVFKKEFADAGELVST